MTGSEVDLTNVKAIVTLYKSTVEEIANLTKVKDDLNATLKEMMGTGEVGLVEGVPAIRTTVVRTSRFDTKLFRDEFPDLADKFTIQGTQTRLTVVKDAEI